MQVVDLMTAGVITATPDTELKDAARLMVRHRVSGLPVVDGNTRLVGMITEADFLRVEVDSHYEGAVVSTRVGDVMSAPVVTVPPELPLVEAARLMCDEDVKRMPVIDDREVIVGIISRFDVVNAFTRPDELIEDEIKEDLLRRVMFLQPEDVDVVVDNGRVLLSGKLETRSEAALLLELVRRLDGVVTVEDKLSWD